MSVPAAEIVHCGQIGCGKKIVWGRTVRVPDGKGGWKGFRKMPVDYPLGRSPTANLAVRRDGHGTLWIRVPDVDEPIRADEQAADTHWTTCANPPRKRTQRARAPRQLEAPQPGDALFDDTPLRAQTPAHDRVRAMLSDATLYPRRRRG